MTTGFKHDRAMALHRRACEYQQAGRTYAEFAANFGGDAVPAIWKTATEALATMAETGKPIKFIFPYMHDLRAADL